MGQRIAGIEERVRTLGNGDIGGGRNSGSEEVQPTTAEHIRHDGRGSGSGSETLGQKVAIPETENAAREWFEQHKGAKLVDKYGNTYFIKGYDPAVYRVELVVKSDKSDKSSKQLQGPEQLARVMNAREARLIDSFDRHDNPQTEQPAAEVSEAQFDELDYDVDNLTPEQAFARDAVIEVLQHNAKKAGIEIEFDADERELEYGELAIKYWLRGKGIKQNPKLNKTEYGTIQHYVDTYKPNAKKGDEYGVYSANFYYLCTSNGYGEPLTVHTQIPINDNEDLISLLNNNNNNAQVVETTKSISDAVEILRLRERTAISANADSDRGRGLSVRNDADADTAQTDRAGNVSNSQAVFSQSIAQAHTSAGTSLNQVPFAFRKIDWKEGTTNLDLGGGRFDTATNFVSQKGVTNLVFDPFNRDAAHNERIYNAVRNGGVDTVTCCNVLNVIDNEAAIENVVLQTAKALKPDGTAYFSVYEADKSGQAGEAGSKTDQWQNRRPLKDYVQYVEKYYKNVQVKNRMIIAKEAKKTSEKSIWTLDREQTQHREYSWRGGDAVSDGRGYELLKAGGKLYGWAEGNRIHITKAGMNPNTPIHEYSHLWIKAIKKNNAELYENLKELFSRENLPEMYEELDNDPNYLCGYGDL